MSDAGDSPACLLWSETSPPRDVNAGAFLNASGGREMHRRPLTAWSRDDPVELAWHDKLSLPPLRRSPKAVLVAAVQPDMHGPPPLPLPLPERGKARDLPRRLEPRLVGRPLSRRGCVTF